MLMLYCPISPAGVNQLLFTCCCAAGRPAEEVAAQGLVYQAIPSPAAGAAGAAGSASSSSGSSSSGVQLVCPVRGGSLAPQQVSGDLLSHLLGLAQADLGGWLKASRACAGQGLAESCGQQRDKVPSCVLLGGALATPLGVCIDMACAPPGPETGTAYAASWAVHHARIPLNPASATLPPPPPPFAPCP